MKYYDNFEDFLRQDDFSIEKIALNCLGKKELIKRLQELKK